MTTPSSRELSLNLRDMVLPPVMDTSSHDLIKDFFIPLLQNSCYYDRGVGYFSSGWLRISAIGLSSFAENGGRARWVTSPILSKPDWEALKLGSKAQQDRVLFEVLRNNINDLARSLEESTLNALAWMVADGILEFRLAVPRNKLDGEFHDKFGVFQDPVGNKVSFNGSYNDSIQGTRNYESIKVFKSWSKTGSSPVEQDQARFDRLWLNEDPNIKIYELNEDCIDDIIQLRKYDRPYKKRPLVPEPRINEPIPKWDKAIPTNPTWLELRDYQTEAIDNWISADHHGFFNMATGTGKTIAALAAMIELLKTKNRLVILIACPNTHLVLQWEKEARNFGFNPILAFDKRSTWSEKMNRAVSRFNRETSNVEVIITTNDTLTSKRRAFQDILKKVPSGDICFIADEAHNLGSFRTRQRLPADLKYKLALSATPTRYFDDAGSKFLLNYFGESVIEISLDYAIENGFLSRYKYYPHLVYLSDDETLNYFNLSKQIQRLSYLARDEKADDTKYQRLLERRVAVLNNAEAKLGELDHLLEGSKNLQKALFYCSDKQIDPVCEYLISEKHYFVKRVTYRDHTSERQVIFKEFADGIVQALVAMGVLDEGLDIPSTQTAFLLASTGNPKQFIQRRGRVLRKSPEGEKIAIIHDFIAIPNETIEDTTFIRRALKRELKRFKEFASTAENSLEAQEALWNVALEHNLIAELEDKNETVPEEVD